MSVIGDRSYQFQRYTRKINKRQLLNPMHAGNASCLFCLFADCFQNQLFQNTNRVSKQGPNCFAKVIFGRHHKQVKSRQLWLTLYIKSHLRHFQILLLHSKGDGSAILKPQLHCHDFGHDGATIHPDLSSRDASA